MKLVISNEQVKVEIKSFQAIFFDFTTNKKSKNKSISLLSTLSVNFANFLKLINSSCQKIQQKKVVST